MRRERKKPPVQCHILRLPQELLAEIFIAYQCIIMQRQTTLCNTAFDIPSDNSAIQRLLLLESVCRTFRATALGTTQLWTHITLTFHPDPLDLTRLASEVNGLEAWLHRSGTHHPLHICLNCARDVRTEVGGAQLDLLSEAIGIIVGYCGRWQELELALPWVCLAQMRQWVLVNSLGSMALNGEQRVVQMPMLKKVALAGWWHRGQSVFDSEADTTVDIFAGASLEELSLSTFPHHALVVPWERLERFGGHRGIVVDLLDIFRKTPQLVECTLTSTIDVGWGTQLSAVSLPSLRSLALVKTMSVIDYLILPRLQNLLLWLDEANQTIHYPIFVHMMRRSGCALRHFHVCMLSITVPTLMDCLRATPHLTLLVLEHTKGGIDTPRTFMDEAVQQLTPQARRATVIPKLARLEVLGCSRSFRVDALADMLWLRWGTGEGEWGCLESFKLEISDVLKTSMTRRKVLTNDRIRDMAEQGMIIHVHRRRG